MRNIEVTVKGIDVLKGWWFFLSFTDCPVARAMRRDCYPLKPVVGVYTWTLCGGEGLGVNMGILPPHISFFVGTQIFLAPIFYLAACCNLLKFKVRVYGK